MYKNYFRILLKKKFSKLELSIRFNEHLDNKKFLKNIDKTFLYF